MMGELHDAHYPDDRLIYKEHAKQSGYMLLTAFVMMGFYYLFYKPFGILMPSTEALQEYNEAGLSSPLPVLFANWRDYENLHIFFWIGKE
jgi:hypothetical protein